MNLEDVPLGTVVLLRGAIDAIAMRAALVPSVGASRSGCVPLEGADTGVFLEDPVFSTMPALDVSSSVTLSVENIALEKSNTSGISPGDVCILTGHQQASLAVAPAAARETIGGYLVLNGADAGHVITGYHPQIRLGKMGLQAISS